MRNFLFELSFILLAIFSKDIQNQIKYENGELEEY